MLHAKFRPIEHADWIRHVRRFWPCDPWQKTVRDDRVPLSAQTEGV